MSVTVPARHTRVAPEPSETCTLSVLGEPAVSFVVYGEPEQKGSQVFKGRRKADTAVARKGTAILAEPNHDDLKRWQAAIRAVAQAAASPGWVPLDGPLVADMVFTMPRPSGHWGTGRNSGRLRPAAAAATWHTVPPDLDKLQRAAGDALSVPKKGGFGLIVDDSRIVAFRSTAKVYQQSNHPDALRRPGVVIRIWRAPLREQQ